MTQIWLVTHAPKPITNGIRMTSNLTCRAISLKITCVRNFNWFRGDLLEVLYDLYFRGRFVATTKITCRSSFFFFFLFFVMLLLYFWTVIARIFFFFFCGTKILNVEKKRIWRKHWILMTRDKNENKERYDLISEPSSDTNWCEPRDHVRGHATHNQDWQRSRKAEAGLIGVRHNGNLFQGTNTIKTDPHPTNTNSRTRSIIGMTPRSQLIFDKSV